MRRLSYFILLLLGISACTSKPNRDKDALISLNGDQLYYSDLQQAIPSNLSKQDSAHMADDYIDAWITHQLLLQKAEFNVKDSEEIDKLVKEYKEQLLIENYLGLLVEKKADIQPTEEQINTFYENNKEQYILSENILQGVFVILPLDASNKTALIDLLKVDDIDRSVVEAYCIQNAAKVDFFEDQWMTMHSIKKHLPEIKTSEKKMLTKAQFFETEDSLFNYIIKIDDYRLKNTIAPLGYVSNEIKEFLLNNNKISYLRRMEKDLYEDAKNKGLIYDNR